MVKGKSNLNQVNLDINTLSIKLDQILKNQEDFSETFEKHKIDDAKVLDRVGIIELNFQTLITKDNAFERFRRAETRIMYGLVGSLTTIIVTYIIFR